VSQRCSEYGGDDEGTKGRTERQEDKMHEGEKYTGETEQNLFHSHLFNNLNLHFVFFGLDLVSNSVYT
jgi:hypothetical protein